MLIISNTSFKIDIHSSLRHVNKDKISLAESRAKEVINSVKFDDFFNKSKHLIFYLGVETRKGYCISLKVSKLRNGHKYQLVSCHVNEVDYFIKNNTWW